MANPENKKVYGSRELSRIIKKRMTTTIVGIIASFEEVFDKDFPKNYDKASEKELEFQDKFEEFREAAFDKGNWQLRELLKDLEQFAIEYEGYKIQFTNKGKDK